MSNIEEDIKVNNKYIYIKEVAQKVVNRYKEKYKGEKFLPEPSEQTCMAYEILNLLSERETDKKRIKELEVLEEDLRDKRIAYIDTPEFEQNYIPKQKIKEKINENSNMIREIEEKIKKEENSGDICEEYLSDLYKEKSLVERDILTLQELLQEEDK